jgi:iron complex transport system substrate-binding protein
MSDVRIVSLVPSLTHMVCDFGLKSSVIGCTTFCVDPADLRRSAVTIGGTKNPDLEKIASLCPTHILVNEEENRPEHILACEAIAPTLRTYPKTPDDVPQLLRQVGEWLGKVAEGESWAGRVESRLYRLTELSQRDPLHFGRYLYLIWKEPYMAVSEDTYIAGMLRLIGLHNVAPLNPRYPSLSVPEMRKLSPLVIFLSSEPYPFRNRDIKALDSQWTDGDVSNEGIRGSPPHFRKIDGQVLSWYGTMTASGLEYLARLRQELVDLGVQVSQPS